MRTWKHGDASRLTEQKEEHIKQSEPHKPGGRPAGELEKTVIVAGLWESVEMSRRGRMQKPHGRRGASTQAMQTQLLILVCKVVSQTFRPHRRQKATDDASTSGRFCLRGVTGR